MSKEKINKKETSPIKADVEKTIEENNPIEMSKSETTGTKFLIGIFALFVIFIAILVYMNQTAPIPPIEDNESFYMYNQYDFKKIQGTWYTEGVRGNNLFKINLRHGPRELENITIDGNTDWIRSQKEFYVTFDPTEEEFGDVTMANAEISTKLAAHFGMKPMAACTINTTDCFDAGAEIITCDNTNKTVLFLDQSPGAAVIIEDNCITIRGEKTDIIRAADRFMLELYGIMR